MPMGIVSPDEFESELINSSVPSKSVPTIIVPTTPETIPCEDNNQGSVAVQVETRECNNPGRKAGDMNVPDSIRKIIADTVITEGRAAALKLAESLGVSPSSVSAYTDSKTSTSSTENNPSLEQFISTRKRKLGKRALGKLALALDALTKDKLQDAKPGVIAGVAVSMSQIAKNLDSSDSDKNGASIVNKPVFILYTPPQKDESKYEVVHSRE